MNTLIVQATLSTAFAILAEAALSFLGLGPQPPYPSWGQDINYSQRYLANLKWWMSVGPEDRDLHRRLRVQLPRGRASRRPGSAPSAVGNLVPQY